MCSYDVAVVAHTAGQYNQCSRVMQQLTTWRALPTARLAKLAQLKLGQPATSDSHTVKVEQAGGCFTPNSVLTLDAPTAL